MVACIMLGAPLSRMEVLEIVRRYIDQQSENTTYRRGQK